MPCRRSATACSVASRVKSPEVAPRSAAAVARAYLLSEQAASSHGHRDGSQSSGGVGWSEARLRGCGAAPDDALGRRGAMAASLGGGSGDPVAARTSRGATCSRNRSTRRWARRSAPSACPRGLVEQDVDVERSERSGSHDRRWRATRPASKGSAPGGTGRPGSRPSTKAWSASRVRARVWAPSGATQRSWCHWNHGPASTRPGSSVSTAYHPSSTSERGHHRAAEGRRQGLAAEADPEHRYAGRVRVAEEVELGHGPGCRSGRGRRPTTAHPSARSRRTAWGRGTPRPPRAGGSCSSGTTTSSSMS